MPKCFYCGKEYNLERGLTLVELSGKIKHFCSSKCRKNEEMHRKKKKWALKEKKKI